MKKSGFTLVEILITLGIVGIIAACTIPTLVAERKAKVNDAALKTAVTDFQTAMQVMLHREDVQDLFQTEAWSAVGSGLDNNTADADVDRFMGEVSPYVELSGHKTLADTDEFNTMREFTTRKNFTYLISIDSEAAPKLTEMEAMDANTNLLQRAARVVIDVNGDELPNTLEEDRFSYILGADGVLFPADSADVTNYNNNAN